MSDLFADLLPLILGATLAPIYPILVLLLLQSERGLAKSTSFVIGAVAVRLAQGVLFGLVLRPAVEAESAAGLKLIGPTLLMVVGILLLAMGVKKWRKGSGEEDDEEDDEEPPAWMSKLTGMSALRAAGAGALLILVSVKQWVFTLSAIAVIEEAQLGAATGAGLYLLFTLATQILVVVPLLAFAIAPQRSAEPLQAAQAWLGRHNRTITIAVSLVFGALFLYKGIAGLVAFAMP